MDVYRAKRNVALAEGIWRQGTDRLIDPAQFSDAIARGQIVRVGQDVVEVARPALPPDALDADEPLPPVVDDDEDFTAHANLDADEHEHPGTGERMTGVEHPADGTLSLPLSSDDELPDDPEFDVDPDDDSH